MRRPEFITLLGSADTGAGAVGECVSNSAPKRR